MKARLLQIGKSILFIATGLLILYFVFYKFDQQYAEECVRQGTAPEDCSLLRKLWSDFLSVNVFWIVAACCAFLLSNVSRALRWKQLLAPLGHTIKWSNAFWSIMLGYFTNLGFPRIGEVIRAGSLSRYERIPIEQSMGTIVADRVVDMVSMGLMFFLALALEFDILWGQLEKHLFPSLKSTSQNYWVWLIFGCLIVLLLVLYRIREKLYSLGIVLKLRSILLGFWQGIKSIRRVKRPWVFVAHSITIWLMYYLMTYLTFLSFAPTSHLGLSEALLVFVFGSLGMVIPSPGGMGTFQGLVALAVTFYGLSLADGFSYANINFFSIQIFCNILFGLLALLILPVVNRERMKKLKQQKQEH